VTNKIDIFVCGVQKGGTTSLYAHMCTHPELSHSFRKELHIFDDETINWSKPNYEMLKLWFDENDGRRLRFEATPIYSFWPPVMERLRAYNRNARLIFLFRDPFERAWSQWQMEYERGTETLPFSLAIRDGRRRMDHLPPLAPERRVYAYIERGFYGEQVQRALAFYPKEQLLFLGSHEFFRDYIGTLQKISKFLHISPFPDVGPKHEMRRPEKLRHEVTTKCDREYVAEMVRPSIRLFADLTRLDVSDWPVMSS
jgi:hypothetical protein